MGHHWHEDGRHEAGRHQVFKANKKALLIALSVTTGIMLVEAVGGFLSNSLALLSDAGHMLTDVMALVLSLVALQFTARPASVTKTYGFYRMEILAALVNGSSLLLISLLIGYEAYRRFRLPQEVDLHTMLAVAALGFSANLVAAIAIMPRSKHSLNLRGAYLHILGDALSSLGVIAGGVVIFFTGWSIVDPLISVGICLVIMRGAVKLVYESVNVLLEAVPRDLDLEEIQKRLLEIRGVKELHDVHLWTISSGIYAMSAHVLVDDMLMSSTGQILQEINRVLKSEYGIEHTTIQLECENCQEGFYCGIQTGCVGITRSHSGAQTGPG